MARATVEVSELRVFLGLGPAASGRFQDHVGVATRLGTLSTALIERFEIYWGEYGAACV